MRVIAASLYALILTAGLLLIVAALCSGYQP